MPSKAKNRIKFKSLFTYILYNFSILNEHYRSTLAGQLRFVVQNQRSKRSCGTNQ